MQLDVIWGEINAVDENPTSDQIILKINSLGGRYYMCGIAFLILTLYEKGCS